MFRDSGGRIFREMGGEQGNVKVGNGGFNAYIYTSQSMNETWE